MTLSDRLMGDIDGRDADLALDFVDFVAHIDAQLGVEVGQGFIKEQDRRFHDQGAGQGHTLLLAAGQLVRRAVAKAFQPDHGHDVVDFPLDFVLRQLFDFQAVGHVVEQIQVGEEGVALEDHGRITFVRRQAVDARVPDIDVAGRGDFKAGDHAQDGRLAAARRAEQGNELAWLDAQVHFLDGLDGLAVNAGIHFFQVLYSYTCGFFCHLTLCPPYPSTLLMLTPIRLRIASKMETTMSTMAIKTVEYAAATPRRPTST